MLKKLSDKEYFKAKGVNASALKEFAKSPAHYGAYLTREPVKKSAFDIGTLTHSLILEGQQNWEIVEGRRNGTAVKEKIAEVEASGKIAIKPGEDVDIIKMAESVKANRYGKKLGVDPERAELCAFVECPETGLTLKAKFDYAPEKGNVCYDLKTAQSAKPNKFKWSAIDFGYDIQCAHYLHVAKLAGCQYEHFIFVVVEKSAPYITTAFILDDESMERANDRYFSLLHDFKKARESNDFSAGYTDELVELSI